MWIDRDMVRKVVYRILICLLALLLLFILGFETWKNEELRVTTRAFENCQADRERLGSENTLLDGEGETCRSSLKECRGAVKVLRSLLDEHLRKGE
jgi:hypothetical protein